MFKKTLLILILLGFVACKKSLTESEKQQYLEKGKEITQTSYKALSGKLTQQMKAGGTKQAIPFCNIEAIPLTDSLSKKFDVSIKRTSDKLRNQDNDATNRELEVISNYKNLKSQEVVLHPIVEEGADKKIHFYAPIITNAKCLKCHGKVGEMTTIETDSIIKSLYPNDMATGYRDEEVRGIWSITFNK